jgi:hypothetical protein
MPFGTLRTGSGHTGSRTTLLPGNAKGLLEDDSSLGFFFLFRSMLSCISRIRANVDARGLAAPRVSSAAAPLGSNVVTASLDFIRMPPVRSQANLHMR